MSDTPWIPALPLDALPIDTPTLFKHGTDRVAIVRSDTGVYALDNVCPHEGYPLSQGTVKDGQLTCCWHNFKFGLADGGCAKGEPVRTYPVRVTDGAVEIQLQPVDISVEGPRLRASFHEALSERRMGQAARDMVRQLQLGITPLDIALSIVTFDAERAQWGPSHAFAQAIDAIELSERHEPTLALIQAAEMTADANVRRPLRERPAPVDPGPDPVTAGQRLRALVEAEDVVGAEALVRGAVARGWRGATLRPWFTALCADHFLNFGHALIYTTKAFELLDRLHWPADAADVVLGVLVFGITNGTREEVVPEWSHWRKRMAAIRPPFGTKGV